MTSIKQSLFVVPVAFAFVLGLAGSAAWACDGKECPHHAQGKECSCSCQGKEAKGAKVGAKKAHSCGESECKKEGCTGEGCCHKHKGDDQKLEH